MGIEPLEALGLKALLERGVEPRGKGIEDSI
jgi:hypothetical protein